MALGSVFHVDLQIVRRNQRSGNVPHQPFAYHLGTSRTPVTIEDPQQQAGRVHAGSLRAGVLDGRVRGQLVRVVALDRTTHKVLRVFVCPEYAVDL